MTQATTPIEAGAREREFAFGDEDFRSLRDLVRQVTGITLADSKRELVYGRLSRRLRALDLASFRAYRDLLAGPDGEAEMAEFTNAITTNLTSFFRENHHFDYLKEQLQRPDAPRRLRVWSAGCSTGEEPYSIAMTVAEALPEWQRMDIRILATDLDSEVLARGSAGLYRADRIQPLSPRRRAAFFRATSVDGTPMHQVDPRLQAMITFRQLNLMHALPMSGPLDVIFCRNVVIYFDKDTQRALFERIAKLQRPGDLLFLGHSETLFRVSDAYTLIGKTIYRRNES